MTLRNKFNLTDSSELSREEERINRSMIAKYI